MARIGATGPFDSLAGEVQKPISVLVIGQSKRAMDVMAGDTKSRGKGRRRRTVKKPKRLSTVARSLADMTGNIIPLYREVQSSPELSRFPKGHMADVILFTGVQIVRNGTEG